MASYSVAAGEVGAQAKTLVANTADTVTIDRDANEIIVTALNTAGLIYFTVDGTAPTVAGNNTYVVPNIVGASKRVTVPSAGDTVVRLISGFAAMYSVEAV